MYTTPESYGKVVEKRISLEMERLKGSRNGLVNDQ
jgi:hypothetical protein